MDCIFCKIANKESSSEIFYEDREILVFKNINLEAPIHLLVIPKKHLEWQNDFSQEDLTVLSRLISVAKKVALEQNIFQACKFIFNIGKAGHIAHIHLHILGGWQKEVPQHNI